METNRYPGVERMELARLSRQALGRQLAGILGREPEASLVDSIFARSEGNPFFAEELVAAGAERGPLPPTLREVLAARLAQVSETTLNLLGVAAVVGRRVDHDLLAKVADLPEDELEKALSEALSTQLLVADALNPREGYAFRHALLAEAAAETVLPGRRRRLHASIAQALSESSGLRGAEEAAHLIEIAHHWFEARELDRAFVASLVAGDAAQGADAYPEALHQYERALELWDIVPSAGAQTGLDRVDLLRRTAHAAQLSGEYARAAQLIREGIELARARGDRILEGLLFERLGRTLWTAVDFAGSMQAYRRAIELVPKEPVSEDRARVLAGYAQVLMLAAHYGESLEVARRALELARETGSRQLEGHAMNTLGVDLAMLGDVDAGLALTEQCLAIAEEVHDLDDLGRGYANHCSVLDVAGRQEEATEVALRGVARMRELGMATTYGAFNAMNASDGLIIRGRWDEALALVKEVQPTARGTGRLYATRELAYLLVLRGDFAGASLALSELAQTYFEGGEAQFNGPIAVARLELARMTGDTAAGRQVADQAIEMVSRSDDMLGYAQVLLAALQLEAAAAELARAARDAGAEREAIARGAALLEASRGLDRGLKPARAARIRQPLAFAEAEATRFAASDAAAWRRALATAADHGPAYEAAYATYRLAESLVPRRSDRAEAAELLGRANELAARLGARPLQEAIAALAARARIQLPPVEAANDAVGDSREAATSVEANPALAGYGLSGREVEVLRLVAAGRTNRQIGEALFISESTAGVHVSHILTKLGVAGRVEAATIAARLGLT